MRTAAYEPLRERGIRPQNAPYVDFNFTRVNEF